MNVSTLSLVVSGPLSFNDDRYYSSLSLSSPDSSSSSASLSFDILKVDWCNFGETVLFYHIIVLKRTYIRTSTDQLTRIPLSAFLSKSKSKALLVMMKKIMIIIFMILIVIMIKHSFPNWSPRQLLIIDTNAWYRYWYTSLITITIIMTIMIMKLSS